jgi:acetyltransferase-like isoleucine patch superfamily enzyme
MLQTINTINPLQTLYGCVKARSKQVRFYRNVHLHWGKAAQLDCQGRLEFGIQYPHGIHLPSQLVLQQNSHVIVQGDFAIFTGGIVWVNSGAKMVLGSGYIGSYLRLHCYESIEIGHDVAISENVTIRDSDNHKFNANEKISSPIKIGDHVWIGMNVTILKGVTIGDGAVIAAGAVVNKDIPGGSLAAGVPAIVKKTGICWEK